MSLINEYRETQEKIRRLQERLNNLSQDNRLKEELDFEKKLRDLMNQYGKSLSEIISILDPGALSQRDYADKPTSGRGRRARRVKEYRNPHTGEMIRTKGGNQKVLKQWKAQWGSDEVESWSTILD